MWFIILSVLLTIASALLFPLIYEPQNHLLNMARVVLLHSAYLLSIIVLSTRLRQVLFYYPTLKFVIPAIVISSIFLFLTSTTYQCVGILHSDSEAWARAKVFTPVYLSLVMFFSIVLDMALTTAASKVKGNAGKITKEGEDRIYVGRLFSMLLIDTLLSVCGVFGLVVSQFGTETPHTTDPVLSLISEIALTMRFSLEMAYQYNLTECIKKQLQSSMQLTPQVNATVEISGATGSKSTRTNHNSGRDLNESNIVSNLSLKVSSYSIVQDSVRSKSPMVDRMDFRGPTHVRKASVDSTFSRASEAPKKDTDPILSSNPSRRASVHTTQFPTSRRNSAVLKAIENRRRSSVAESTKLIEFNVLGKSTKNASPSTSATKSHGSNGSYYSQNESDPAEDTSSQVTRLSIGKGSTIQKLQSKASSSEISLSGISGHSSVMKKAFSQGAGSKTPSVSSHKSIVEMEGQSTSVSSKASTGVAGLGSFASELRGSLRKLSREISRLTGGIDQFNLMESVPRDDAEGLSDSLIISISSFHINPANSDGNMHS
jgi:hypothetical protein